MPQGQHRTRSRLGTRLVLGLLSVATCAGLAVGLSPGAFAVSTTQLQWDLAGMAYLPFSGIDGATGPATTAATKADSQQPLERPLVESLTRDQHAFAERNLAMALTRRELITPSSSSTLARWALGSWPSPGR
ncbi:MAG: hypothetical protein QOD31_584 [Pseudonocardiales bacterium]|jgi:hypothetical protein|nr:hypothetical protein [Pseudonocardiales bacterium]